jgi:hypothetical protein
MHAGSFKGETMQHFVLLFAIIMSSTLSYANTCPFVDVEIGDVLESSDFLTTEENQSKIPQNVFWANRDFFSRFNSASCTNAFTTGTIEEVSTGNKYYYYRTIEDSCDGGNTFGIIIKAGESKAMAAISDGFIECL